METLAHDFSFTFDCGSPGSESPPRLVPYSTDLSHNSIKPHVYADEPELLSSLYISICSVPSSKLVHGLERLRFLSQRTSGGICLRLIQYPEKICHTIGIQMSLHHQQTTISSARTRKWIETRRKYPESGLYSLASSINRSTQSMAPCESPSSPEMSSSS